MEKPVRKAAKAEYPVSKSLVEIDALSLSNDLSEKFELSAMLRFGFHTEEVAGLTLMGRQITEFRIGLLNADLTIEKMSGAEVDASNKFEWALQTGGIEEKHEDVTISGSPAVTLEIGGSGKAGFTSVEGQITGKRTENHPSPHQKTIRNIVSPARYLVSAMPSGWLIGERGIGDERNVNESKTLQRNYIFPADQPFSTAPGVLCTLSFLPRQNAWTPHQCTFELVVRSVGDFVVEPVRKGVVAKPQQKRKALDQMRKRMAGFALSDEFGKQRRGNVIARLKMVADRDVESAPDATSAAVQKHQGVADGND